MSGGQNTHPNRQHTPQSQTENVPSGSGSSSSGGQQVEKTITNLFDRYGSEPWFTSALGQLEAQFHELSLGSDIQSCLKRTGNTVSLARSSQRSGAQAPM